MHYNTLRAYPFKRVDFDTVFYGDYYDYPTISTTGQVADVSILKTIPPDIEDSTFPHFSVSNKYNPYILIVLPGYTRVYMVSVIGVRGEQS